MTDNTINNDMTISGGGETLLANRYRVVRQLGHGGMGSVWLAEDTKLDGFKVAIKMLPSVLVNNRRAYAQVKSEALVSLKLSHPNIVTVRAFEEEGGSPLLVMDYIDGRSLDDYLAEKGRLTEEETIRLLKPVAAALDYAHRQGVVHRDVKPGNVMIRRDGVPFVLDFGIAREIQETMTRVTGKLSSGTLLYMSPEQLNGDAPKPAQDIYSFAAMAYECLTGNPPFSRGQIEYQIVNNRPEPLGPQFANCGSRVMAGLAKMPEMRPSACAAVLSADPAETAGVVAQCVDGTNDSEYERVLVEIRRCEDLLAQKETEKRVEQENKERAKALRDAQERLERIRIRIEEEEHGIGEVNIIELPGGATMEMVWCPPGNFLMGSPPSEDGHGDNETLHEVTLTHGFWMGKYAVTQRQWESVMGKVRKTRGIFGSKERTIVLNPASFKGSDRPVENVSWDDSQKFIHKVNDAVKGAFSLPTEAQWEYACRAGTTTPFDFGLSLNGDKANCNGNYPYGTSAKGQYRGVTVPVGTYLPNAWGLCDMHGNVWEWCADWYGDYPTCCVTDPAGPHLGDKRVVRGGCWLGNSCSCRSAYRGMRNPGCRCNNIGFRLVYSAESYW